MSPLRYQKWLRLNEVRRPMLNEHYDVTTAAYAVGYESYPISVGKTVGVAIHLTAINGSISIRRLNVTLFPYAHG